MYAFKRIVNVWDVAFKEEDEFTLCDHSHQPWEVGRCYTWQHPLAGEVGGGVS